MNNKPNRPISRRGLLQTAAGIAAGIGLSRFASAAPLEPTPEVPDLDEDPTPSQTEGPYFTPNSPQRQSIKEGVTGKTLIVEGQVMTTAGTPVAGALLDFWHCDAEGNYDNSGFKLRGHQYADKEGRYRLETIVPGVYPGRTRHIHVKVQAPRGKVLTTQLYFPGDAGNRRDGLYLKQLEMKLTEKDAGKGGKFDFVLRA